MIGSTDISTRLLNTGESHGNEKENELAKKSSSGSDPKSKRIVKGKMKETMHEFKHHELSSGRSGKKVKNPKQAIAIGLSEARRSGAKIPPDPNAKKRSASGAKKKSASKKSGSKATKKSTAKRK